jgi:hypothetical protein
MRRSSGDGDAGSGARQSHLVGIGVPWGGLIMKVCGCCLSHSIVPSSGPPIRRFSQRSPRGLVAGQMLLRPRNLLGVRFKSDQETKSGKQHRIAVRGWLNLVSSLVVVARTVARTVGTPGAKATASITNAAAETVTAIFLNITIP